MNKIIKIVLLILALSPIKARAFILLGRDTNDEITTGIFTNNAATKSESNIVRAINLSPIAVSNIDPTFTNNLSGNVTALSNAFVITSNGWTAGSNTINLKQLGSANLTNWTAIGTNNMVNSYGGGASNLNVIGVSNTTALIVSGTGTNNVLSIANSSMVVLSNGSAYYTNALSASLPPVNGTNVVRLTDLNAATNGDEYTANKAAANGYASLNGSTLVVQNPASAQAATNASKIPISDANGHLTNTWIQTFIGSGATHTNGLVPDAGASAGTTKFLREDATWQVPSGGGSATATNLAASLNGTNFSAIGSNAVALTVNVSVGTSNALEVRNRSFVVTSNGNVYATNALSAALTPTDPTNVVRLTDINGMVIGGSSPNFTSISSANGGFALGDTASSQVALKLDTTGNGLDYQQWKSNGVAFGSFSEAGILSWGSSITEYGYGGFPNGISGVEAGGGAGVASDIRAFGQFNLDRGNNIDDQGIYNLYAGDNIFGNETPGYDPSYSAHNIGIGNSITNEGNLNLLQGYNLWEKSGTAILNGFNIYGGDGTELLMGIGITAQPEQNAHPLFAMGGFEGPIDSWGHENFGFGNHLTLQNSIGHGWGATAFGYDVTAPAGSFAYGTEINQNGFYLTGDTNKIRQWLVGDGLGALGSYSMTFGNAVSGGAVNGASNSLLFVYLPTATYTSDPVTNFASAVFAYEAPGNPGAVIVKRLVGVTNPVDVAGYPGAGSIPVSSGFDAKYVTPAVAMNIRAGHTNVSAATTIVIPFTPSTANTNYTVFAVGDNTALLSPAVTAKATNQFTLTFTVFTGGLDWSLTGWTQ